MPEIHSPSTACSEQKGRAWWIARPLPLFCRQEFKLVRNHLKSLRSNCCNPEAKQVGYVF